MKTIRALIFSGSIFSAALIPAQNSQTHIDSALIACYPFNGNANDFSGNNHHGTVNGAALTTDRFGASNAAYMFTGLTGTTNITVPNFSSLLNGTGASISFWTQKNSYETRAAFLMDPDNTASRFCVCVYYGNAAGNSKIYWDYGDMFNNGRMNVSPCVLPTGSGWDHWAFVASTTGGYMKVYRNGNLIAAQNASSSFSLTSGRALSIGGGFDVNGGNLWFNGKIDDIRIYKRILLPAEVTKLYNDTTPCVACQVNTPVNVSASQTACAGNSILLSAAGSPSVNWYASPASTVSLSGDSTYLTPPANVPGVYTVYARATSTCGESDPVAITYTVAPLPAVQATASSTIICRGDSVLLVATGATGYIWMPGNHLGAMIAVSPTSSVVYTVIGSGGGCTNADVISLSVENCTGVKEGERQLYSLYPNPNNGRFTLDLAAAAEVSVTNILGVVVYKGVHSKTAEINIREHGPGVYLVKIDSGNRTFVHRVSVF